LDNKISHESSYDEELTEYRDQKLDALVIMSAKLKRNKKFNSFFVNMAEEGTIAQFCKLNKA
jgi:hypothetical protein